MQDVFSLQTLCTPLLWSGEAAGPEGPLLGTTGSTTRTTSGVAAACSDRGASPGPAPTSKPGFLKSAFQPNCFLRAIPSTLPVSWKSRRERSQNLRLRTAKLQEGQVSGQKVSLCRAPPTHPQTTPTLLGAPPTPHHIPPTYTDHAHSTLSPAKPRPLRAEPHPLLTKFHPP